MSEGYRVIHRRNNAAPGIALIVTGLLILLSAILPVIDVTGPDVGVLGKAAGVTLTPSGSYNPDPIGLWLWTAAIVFAFGVILLATRVRGLGIFWRILAVIPILVMGTYAGFMWYFLSDPQKVLDPDSQSAGDIARFLQDLGVYKFSAGVGLILLTVAVIVGIVGIFLPSAKSQRTIPAAGGGLASAPPTVQPQQQFPQSYYPRQFPPGGD